MQIELTEEEVKLVRRVAEAPGYLKLEDARVVKGLLVKLGVDAHVYDGGESFKVAESGSKYIADLRDWGMDIQEVQ